MYSNQEFKFWILFVLLSISLCGYSQNDSLKKLNYFAFGEFYYSYDFSNPQNHEKSNFIYNHKRHNEINTNLLLLKVNYVDKAYRANVAIMAGNYAEYNLATEASWAQFIYEANIGLKILKNRKLWMDLGIIPSHIGFESVVSADCWTLTRSILAENSPYYETGAKLTYYSRTDKLVTSFLYLNGWQKISKPNDFQRPSFGTQIIYMPFKKLIFNYSTFLGSDKPDSVRVFRHFHNFYMQYEPTNRMGIIVGFDMGSEKLYSNTYGIWYSPVLILRSKIRENCRLAFRGEYYRDDKQIIISTGTKNGFQTFGLSSNFDLDVNEKIMFRLEVKMLHSKDDIFLNQNRNFSLTTNLTFKL
jgi:hypothetical protein